MIEVNLHPGDKKRRKFDFSLPLPDIDGLPTDRWVLGSGLVVILLVVASSLLFLNLNGRYGEVEAAIEEEVRDSARYADLIEQAEQLRARRDSIADRVSIIQEIDRDRYIWPHLMDEVARAVPDYTWLSGLTQISGGPEFEFRIDGLAGNNFALTTFMENLEASRFVRGVTLINTELTVQSAGGASRAVNQFTLEAALERPAMDDLETVPLFEASIPDTVAPAPGR